MAIYYVDLASGSDAAAGTAAAPLLTINAAHAKALGPHDIRVAKTTASTSEAGATTFTWTVNSTSISTSTDVSATFPAGTYIGKPTAAGNGAAETFYRVASVNTSQILLSAKYQGASGTTTGARKQTFVTSGTAGAHMATITTSGTSISGGWDLTTETQNGETWCKSNNVITTASWTNFIVNTTCTISKMNCVETYYAINHSTGTCNTTVDQCTFFSYLRCIFQNINTATLTATDCVFNAYAGETIYTSTSNYNLQSFTDCFFYNNGTALRCGPTSISYLSLTNCVISGATSGITSAAWPADIVLTGNTIKYCTNGVAIAFSGHRITGGTFQNCTNGIGISTISSLWVRDATFTNCTTGIGSRPFGLRVEGCSFSGATYGLYLDQYSSRVEVYDTTFTSNTYDCYIEDYADTVYFESCTSNNLFPLRATGNFSHYNPNYILKNSFLTTPALVDGTYWPQFSVVKDVGTYRVQAPSLRVQASSTAFAIFNCPIKAASSYFPESAVGVEGRDVSVYLKCNSTYTGTITPVLKLNGRTISYEANITSLTTSWVQYTYSFAMADLDTDGELTLEFIYNCGSLIAWFIDDPEWTVT